jgi:hypothetical protein
MGYVKEKKKVLSKWRKNKKSTHDKLVEKQIRRNKKRCK